MDGCAIHIKYTNHSMLYALCPMLLAPSPLLYLKNVSIPAPSPDVSVHLMYAA